ncbi:hypothetical protein [Acinetobacter phage Ab69]|nr:hypothetical protein [Acinetobacter phage Ab69]
MLRPQEKIAALKKKHNPSYYFLLELKEITHFIIYHPCNNNLSNIIHATLAR